MCREPWASKIVENTPWISIDVQRLLEIHLLDKEDAPGSPLPSQPHRCIMHLAADPGHVRWCGITYTIIRALTNHQQAYSTHLETHEVIIVPPHPLGAPHVYCLENKGPTPCPLLLEVQLMIFPLMDFIRPLREPNDMHYWSFNLLGGLLFYLWASLVACHQ